NFYSLDLIKDSDRITLSNTLMVHGFWVITGAPDFANTQEILVLVNDRVIFKYDSRTIQCVGEKIPFWKTNHKDLTLEALSDVLGNNIVNHLIIPYTVEE